MKKDPSLLDIAKQKYQNFLKEKSMFFTKERHVILEFILDQSEHFSADDLLFNLQKSGKKVSRATVYRSLSQMVESGILEEADFGHGHTHYELALGSEKHIHLICKQTNEVKEVKSEALNKLLSQIAKKEKFDLEDFRIQLLGSFQ